MKKISFKIQVYIVFAIMGIGHLLAYLLKNGLCINIAWLLCGLLFLINPVYPNKNNIPPKKGAFYARIGGVIVIILGLFIRNGV